MRHGWVRNVRSNSFFYQNMPVASRARKRKRTNPLVLPESRCWRPSGHAASERPGETSSELSRRHGPLLHGIFFYLLNRRRVSDCNIK